MAKLTDTTLLAYVDGELDSNSAHQISIALETDPEARERVDRLRQSAVLARAVFERPSSIIMCPKLRALIDTASPRRYRRIFFAAAASIAIAAISFGSGFLVELSRARQEISFDARLFDEVADYHTMYAYEDDHQVEVSADRREHIEEWLGARLQRRLHVPDLTDRALHFVGARLLVVDGSPVAQLVYHWPGQPHKPLALCITFGSPDEQPIKADARDGVQQILWRHRGYTYVLVGWASQPMLNSLAAEVTSILDHDLSS